MINRFALLAATSALVALPAYAQPVDGIASEGQGAAPAEQPPHLGHEHHDSGGEIIVTGVRKLDILAGTAVLSGEELQREVRTQLGDSLTGLPGVSATSFAPGASRPVLRGFQGERIRVLTDGIGAIDVSNTSADHAVTVDPLTAERVEVLHGPAVLLFGSQAIGGAVNVIDRRIPRSVPEEGVHGDVVGTLASAADDRSIGAAVDFRLSKTLVAHIDANFSKTDDLRSGGFVLSRSLRAEQAAIAAEEADEGHVEEAAEALALAGMRGRVPNSATEQKSGGAGLAYIAGNLDLGVSVSRFESKYGVPSRPGFAHAHEEGAEGGESQEGHFEDEPVSIDLKQTRFDFRGGYALESGFLEEVRLRIGAADYKHIEFEGDEIGTTFTSEGIEGRLELAQRKTERWGGASGVQYFTRDFDAIGPEAFVPPNRTSQLGLFTLQEIDFGRVGLEAAGRFERSEVKALEPRLERTFNALSIAGGISFDVDPRTKVGLNLSRSERAPSAEELFADGPHVATQAYEIGDPSLKTEKSVGAEAFLRIEKSAVQFNASLYSNWFDDFIYQAATGDEEDGLPVLRQRQRNARFTGFEAQASAQLGKVGRFKIVADAVADYVRATIRGGGPVPRIPPLRLLGGIEAQSDRLDGRVEVEWVADQDRVAAMENPTDGFTLVNASLALRPWGKDREAVLLLGANNIFDVEARRHASFTKDFVPLAGRDIRLSARFGF